VLVVLIFRRLLIARFVLRGGLLLAGIAPASGQEKESKERGREETKSSHGISRQFLIWGGCHAFAATLDQPFLPKVYWGRESMPPNA
jgi:hypothetical protein